jgi:hypothetical protein
MERRLLSEQIAERVARRFIPKVVLEGESEADFKDLLTRICAMVRPVNVIEEMFVADIACLQWELLRWRRLTWTWLRMRQLEALRSFVAEHLGEDHYLEDLAQDLAETLEQELPEGEAEILVKKCFQGDAIAIDKVKEVLARKRLDLNVYKQDVRQSKTEELVQEYARHTPDAVALIDELLTDAGLNMDTLTADALTEDVKPFEYIEKFERLAAVAESRLSARVREIEQRRAIFGAALRRSVQEIEDSERKVIDIRPAKGTKVG